MSVDGPTDVITFRHGEIVISVETAERQAKEYSTSFDRELRLYFVHGLLHLVGLEDKTDQGFKRMADSQRTDRCRSRKRWVPVRRSSC